MSRDPNVRAEALEKRAREYREKAARALALKDSELAKRAHQAMLALDRVSVLLHFDSAKRAEVARMAGAMSNLVNAEVARLAKKEPQ